MQMRTNESRVAILLSDQIDFEIKAVKGDKEGHYIMIKGLIQEEDVTIINTCTANRSASIYNVVFPGGASGKRRKKTKNKKTCCQCRRPRDMSWIPELGR